MGSRTEKAKEVDVVVVGGGVAGLTALNTLLQHNLTNVVLLEAQDRLGGRVRTYRQGRHPKAIFSLRMPLFYFQDEP